MLDWIGLSFDTMAPQYCFLRTRMEKGTCVNCNCCQNYIMFDKLFITVHQLLTTFDQQPAEINEIQSKSVKTFSAFIIA